ncbi:MAG: hypothetical protein GWM92_17750 [Gemmatimonadetes bacterium]|nr:hypothetical protein [Gemmatimonadota bacterium]NIR80629.1 hypothetical protein [Gemmatimonadota bacterium]NIT89416.1 hypothetical protein [Gemmatimonadota bacterium]NIU33220.1 hypothetical protein [Gemmatimonadota bacterium]NIU37542.1 hypothetical protein [Gemmatimonadota bacterium]
MTNPPGLATALTPAGILSLALLGCAGTAAAQQAGLDVPPGLEVLSPGDAVRLTAATVRIDDGTFLGFGREVLRVRDEREEVEVPMREVRSVHVQGRATWEGLWKGAIIGTAMGAAIGVIVDGADCPAPSDCENQYWPRVPIDAGIGLGIGSAVGAGVGWLFPEWRLVFP